MNDAFIVAFVTLIAKSREYIDENSTPAELNFTLS
jgi:hypothetical protein